jgi:hypothetical protein
MDEPRTCRSRNHGPPDGPKIKPAAGLLDFQAESPTAGREPPRGSPTPHIIPDPAAPDQGQVKDLNQCPHCGGTQVEITRCSSDSPHYARVSCFDCRRVWWGKTPWDATRAWNFTLPFGKHRGSTVGDLAESPSGRGYLKWLAENTEGNAAKAAGIVLQLVSSPTPQTPKPAGRS